MTEGRGQRAEERADRWQRQMGRGRRQKAEGRVMSIRTEDDQQPTWLRSVNTSFIT
jgi:hypothetical protein